MRVAGLWLFLAFCLGKDYRDGKCGSFLLSLGGLGSQVRKTWRERRFAWGGLQNGKIWLLLTINRQNLVKKRKGFKSGSKWWPLLRKTGSFRWARVARRKIGGFSGHGRFQLFGGLQNGKM